MNEVLDDFSDASKSTTNKKSILAFVLFIVMFTGSALYNKYVNVTGSRADFFVLTTATFIFVFLCIGLSTISVLLGRLFHENKSELIPIKSKTFWLDRVIGGFVNWLILMFLILAGHFL